MGGTELLVSTIDVWCVSFCFARQIESQKSSVTSCSHDRTGTADGFLEVEENFYFIRFSFFFVVILLFEEEDEFTEFRRLRAAPALLLS